MRFVCKGPAFSRGGNDLQVYGFISFNYPECTYSLLSVTEKITIFLPNKRPGSFHISLRSRSRSPERARRETRPLPVSLVADREARVDHRSKRWGSNSFRYWGPVATKRVSQNNFGTLVEPFNGSLWAFDAPFCYKVVVRSGKKKRAEIYDRTVAPRVGGWHAVARLSICTKAVGNVNYTET